MIKSALHISRAIIRVMLVDDSATTRHLIEQSLSSSATIKIVATAANIAMAIPLAAERYPDIIVLDADTAETGGLKLLPQLLSSAPGTRVIIISSLTKQNTAISLDALEYGASGYVAKTSSPHDAIALHAFYQRLHDNILALGTRLIAVHFKKDIARNKIPPVHAIAIAASTGGPQALMKVLGDIKGQFLNMPIFITQHMPPGFTTLLAEHLSQASGQPCHEGEDGEIVEAGHIYLAPGDYHMTVKKYGNTVKVHTDQNAPENFCRPSADPMLRSLSAVYGEHLFAVILTGMGADGLGGSRAVHEAGGSIITQDEATSVVWGMPRAVFENGLSLAVLPLPDIAPYMIRMAAHAH